MRVRGPCFWERQKIGATTKGKGVSYMENVPMWHYRSPNQEEYEQAMRELGGVE